MLVGRSSGILNVVKVITGGAGCDPVAVLSRHDAVLSIL